MTALFFTPEIEIHHLALAEPQALSPFCFIITKVCYHHIASRLICQCVCGGRFAHSRPEEYCFYPHFPTMVFLEVVFLATALFLCWSIHIAIHRLYFSPLAKFPGPKLAALTYWYEFYYDCVCHGRFSWDIQRMHDKHGLLFSGKNSKDHHTKTILQVLSFA